MTQVHQLNIKTIRLLCFCFICRISRSLCNLMLWFLEWYFVAVGLVKIILQSDGQNDTKSLCGHKANSFHCLNISFIQYINFQYLAGFHSVVYIVHLGKLMHDRLSNRNETKFDFIAKEEEECGLIYLMRVKMQNMKNVLCCSTLLGIWMSNSSLAIPCH
jgi:hypothetical protein